jgi:hypothetical protein
MARRSAVGDPGEVVAMTIGMERVESPPGSRWLVQVLAWGPSSNGNFWPSYLGADIAERIRHAPVGCFREGRRFTHRPGGLLQSDADFYDRRILVGMVARSWFDRRRGVFAELALADDATWVHMALRKMEADKRLGLMGISLVARVIHEAPRIEMGRLVRYIVSVTEVESVDLVSVASAGGRVIRSIPDKEGLNDARS